MDFEEEPVIQLFTIVKNENNENLNQQNAEDLYTIGDGNIANTSVIFMTVNQDDQDYDEDSNMVDPLLEGIYGNIDKPTSGLKLVTLENGQMYLAPTDSSDDNSSSLETQLLPDIAEEPPLVDEILPNTDDDDEANFREIHLEDGTSAYINASLWNSLVENCDAESDEKVKKKRFSCQSANCGKSFTTAHHLEVHTRIHTGNRPYICTEEGCDKAFATGYSLKAHSRTHTGEKPYGCAACHKHFKTSGDLQKHIRTHTGEKPFKCPFEGCEKSFTTSNIRKVHVRSHTGERPYVCKECSKAFASATNFKNHVRIHSGEKPYLCNFIGCGKRFTEYSSLYKHNSVHQPFKILRCDYCNQCFKFENTLKLHKKTVHNIIITDDGTEFMFSEEQSQGQFDETDEFNSIIDSNLLSDENSLQYGE